MLSKIIRNFNVLNGRKDLIKMKSIKNFPVFMGVTKKNIKRDKRFNMNFYISKSTGVVQLNPILPFKTIYQKGHNSGLIGSLWKQHHHEFAKFVKKFKSKKVLEIGGGHGILSKNLNSNHKNWTIIEPNPSPIKGCKAKFIKGYFSKNIIKDVEYDTIVHSHVLEHVFYPKDFLREISSSLKVNQKMIFSIPNLQEMIKRKYTNALNFEHTLYLDEEILDFLFKLFSFKIIKKQYFKKDHSIFFAVKKTSNTNSTKIKNNYKKNKKLFQDYFINYDILTKKINKGVRLHKNKNVFLFGAHVFSQYLISLGLNQNKILYILDNDKMKQNQRLYGTKLSVKSPEILKNFNKPLVVLKAGVYNDEIRKQIYKINKSTKII